VKQAGSLVDPDRLRFDFSHYAGLSEEILHQVEDEINDVIRQDLPIVTRVMPLDEALRRGALAFFGDKYGDEVRVVEVPGFSMELCGGTHAASTGSIGLLKLTQERGIAAGIRRVEALAGRAALREAREDRRLMQRVQSALNVERARIHETLARLLEQNRAMAREIERLKIDRAAGGGAPSESQVQDVDGVKLMVPAIQRDLDKSAVRALVDRNRERLESGVIIQWAEQDDRVHVTVSVSKDLIPPLHAGAIVKELAVLVGGRGGGKADLAEAGGRRAGDLESARQSSIAVARQAIKSAKAAR
jgi:alanyl-tRNA synthetase